MQHLNRVIGLAGVDEQENPIAQRMGKYFSMVLVGTILWLMIQWQMELQGRLSYNDAWYANLLVWLFFVVETMALTYLVDNKMRYLKHNWLNLTIIFVGLPLLIWEFGPLIVALRIVRVFLIFGLLIPWFGVCRRFLTDNRLDTTIFAVFIILFLSGTLITAIDPAINSIEDGIWWAWVTISTVGYGDVVPVSTYGRLFSALLILIGMGLFAIITANFSAIFVKRDVKRNKFAKTMWVRTFDELEKIQQQEVKILRQLSFMEKQMLEQQKIIEELRKKS